MLIGMGVLLLLPQVGPSMERRTVAFEADYEKLAVAIDNDGRRTESRELYRLYHDARGRTRMEGSTPAGRGEALRFAFITDLANRRCVVVDLATGNVLKRWPCGPPDGPAVAARRKAPDTPHGPVVGSRQKVPDAPPKPEPQTVEDLGEAEIEGLRARGMRTTTPSFGVSEVWHALAIDQPPLLVKSKGPNRETTERLFNIRIGEPDPALFAPLEPKQ